MTNNPIKDELIWYVAYGSNLLRKRFDHYIKGTKFRGRINHYILDDRDLVDDQPITIPFNIYYAMSSSWWQDQGVAFLDHTKAGFAYGRAYLIYRTQLKQIIQAEGIWYHHPLDLGLFKGYPTYTMTHPEALVRTQPGEEYINTIKQGLRECYPELTEHEIEAYIQRTLEQ
jgi:hypothetical protein